MNEAQNILKKYFGYENFRQGQEEIIKHILNSEDVLGIMPTGAGKSICYQVPAMILDGVTIVISPLISLMKDQVDSLNEIGIPSTYVNSTLSYNNYEQTIENILNNVYKIVYVAPERLNSDIFLNLLNKINVSMVTIDEAHCVSQWGHDFRPSYREIANMILNLKKRPIVSAFTATATEIVKEDIINLLHLEKPFCLTTGFDRKNLKFSVETPYNKFDFIENYINEHKNDSGIIYCLTRKNVDTVFDNLSNLGLLVSKYHGGMTEKQRSSSQEDFTFDRTKIMVATNAFGMGIDKSNIRYVIHYNMPKDLESYYQEAGRGGRDGEKADCILLFSRSDIVTNKVLIEAVPSSSSHNQEYEKLNDMVDYCNTDKCLRKYILEYFGEKTDFDNCGNCSNCLDESELVDITSDTQKILSCIKRMNERFGSSMVVDVLRGSKGSRIISLGFDNLSTYGIMKDYPKDNLRDLISYLITEGYIKTVGDKYPVLMLTPLSNDVLFNGQKVFTKMKFSKPQENSSLPELEKMNTNISAKPDEVLFDILTDLRMQIAKENNIAPFIVFSDASLKQMATYFPTDAENMLKIEGVGLNKLVKYGNKFIEAILDYVSKNNIDTLNLSVQKKTKEKTQKQDSKLITYNMYLNGMSIEDIMNERNFSRTTIEGHLIDCLEKGLNIDLEKYVQVQYKEQIEKVINELGVEKLKPLKEALPEKITYFDIRYYVALSKLNKR